MPQATATILAIPPRLDQRIRELLELRDVMEEHEDKHKQFMAQFYKLDKRIEGEIQDILKRTGQFSAKTEAGTARIQNNITAACDDPDAFMAYVTKHGAYWLMNRTANKTGCQDHLDEHGRLPPGVHFNSRRVLIVTKATES